MNTLSKVSHNVNQEKITSQHCFRLKSGLAFLSIANDSETNNSMCQAMLASFAKALQNKMPTYYLEICYISHLTFIKRNCKALAILMTF